MYECTKLLSAEPLVIKVSTDHKMLGKEIRCLSRINSPYVPTMVASGLFISKQQDVSATSIESLFADTKTIYAYYVMPQYGKNLELLFREAGH